MERNLVMEMKEINLVGNVIDNGWIENLKYENGKPHLNAIMILSEIVYWYRPTEVRDELTGAVIGYKKKFKSDMLQKSYDSLGERFGLSDRQAKSSIDFLISKNLIHREFRTIIVNGIAYNNVMFLAPIIEEIKKITGINRYIEEEKNNKNDTLLHSNVGGVLHSNVTPSYNQMYHPPTTECKTNTKTTTKTTNKDYLISSSSKDNQKEIKKLIKMFEENICELKKTTKPKFVNWCNKLDIELIKAIVEYGAETNAKSYSWFETTLLKNLENNINTKEQFVINIENYREKRKKKKTSKKATKTKANFTQRDYDYDDLTYKLSGGVDCSNYKGVNSSNITELLEN